MVAGFQGLTVKEKGKQMSNLSLCEQSCRVATLAIALRDLGFGVVPF